MDHLLPLAAGLDFPSLPQQLVNGLMLGAIYALIALGYTMVYGVLRLINFAHGEVYMLGAYVALFVSYALGFQPGGGTGAANAWTLLLMLLASMVVCAIVGVLIERFAYRPMRSQPRIASLITAIGVSLLLQYGGALFLPNSPPPSISENVNPYRATSLSATLAPPSPDLTRRAEEACTQAKSSQLAFDEYLKRTKEAAENLSDQAKKLRRAAKRADRSCRNLRRQAETSAITVNVQAGGLIILVTTLALMAVLTYLVLYTKAGRAMRAVSHDFDSASLMGVNVNLIVVFTFILGSSLAGAGAMMTATFLGTPLTTFYGLLPGVKAFVAAVLGGIGNIPGAVLGGLLMGVAETLVVWAGYSSYRDAIAFVILIAVLMFRPGGLLGSAKVEKV